MRTFFTMVGVLLVIFPSTILAQGDINFFRSNFEKCKTEQDFQKIIDTQITDTSLLNVNVIHAYKAVSVSAMAQYVFNPYTKFKLFFEGKDQLENSIQKNATVENVFLRLVVQLNIPSFLGYSKDIENDLTYLQNNLEAATIPVHTKKFIVKTIVESDNDAYNLKSLSLLTFKAA